jgi:subtilisin family serine protease
MNGEAAVWADRVLVALADLVDEVTETGLIEQVAVRFADRFGPSDRVYAANADCPRWHDAVREALRSLVAQGLVHDGDSPALSPAGRDQLDAARAATAEATTGAGSQVDSSSSAEAPLLLPGVIAPPLRSGTSRKKMGFTPEDDVSIPVMIEVNLRFAGGVDGAFARLEALWQRVTDGQTRPSRVSEQYAAGELSMQEMERLVAADAAPVRWPRRSIIRLWPDFPVRLHVDASCVTVKADAARRSFNAYGDGIVWAVIDSGIWGEHPHFAGYHTLDHDDVKDLHRTFPVLGDPTPDGALVDDAGHGTHVAGIIAGAAQPWLDEKPGLDEKPKRSIRATENRYNVENPREPLRVPREIPDPSLLAGMAPRARLVSLKVLQSGGTPQDRVHRVIRALAYVREVNGGAVDGMRIHGVNLSIGYEFEPEWFACGRSPLCMEVDKLVRSGVVVVVAAGNSGYGTLAVKFEAPTKFGLAMTINDPGNAERAITVGSTHRNAPHTYGVSYFSSKGPTGDGRRKPDLLAPGERITSCAAGANLAALLAGDPPGDTAYYVEDSGTSMAAPHVSGAIAALLSVRREFIGRPEDVKDIVAGSATSLGRGRDFEGAGLLDLMRALQAI